MSGKAITEDNIIKDIKLHDENKRKPKKCKMNCNKKKEKGKKNAKKAIECAEKKSVKNVKSNKNVKKLVEKKRNKSMSNSPKPGPSGLQVIYLSDSEASLSEHESQMSERSLCCVCKKFYNEKMKECVDLTIAKWGECMFEGCGHWTHLRFCCDVRVLRRHSIFYCPCHGVPCLQEE